MMDAYTHLEMSVQDPVGDLEAQMDAAQVNRALIVETWGKDNRSCLEKLIVSPSPRFRVVPCFRPEEEQLSPEILDVEMVGGIRTRTVDIKALGAIADKLEATGKWLIPHAESGIGQLTGKLLSLAAQHPRLNIYVPHLGWPRRDQQNDSDWSESISSLSTLPNVIVGISAIAYFSREAFPHRDVEPFAAHLIEVFGAKSIVPASDYPLFERGMYEDYMKLAAEWIWSRGESNSRLEVSLFGNR